jgi:hypothetical protein
MNGSYKIASRGGRVEKRSFLKMAPPDTQRGMQRLESHASSQNPNGVPHQSPGSPPGAPWVIEECTARVLRFLSEPPRGSTSKPRVAARRTLGHRGMQPLDFHASYRNPNGVLHQRPGSPPGAPWVKVVAPQESRRGHRHLTTRAVLRRVQAAMANKLRWI